MNIRQTVHLLANIMLIEAACMLPSLALALFYGDGDAMAFVWSVLLIVALALPLRLLVKPQEKNLRAREGMLVVSLAWIFLAIFGALPFIFSGVLPNFADAVFESVSGFTTTGASIMTQIDGQPRGVMFWRSFTHWVGGMGVLVLTLAIMPQMTGRTSHLVRAESPGPSLSKIVPRTGNSAKILYIIYSVLTLACFSALLFAGLTPYDAAIHAMGTAGTGGFSNYGASIAAFDSVAVEVIITVFMALFGVNFALFYRIATGNWRDTLKSEELHWYGAILLSAITLITLTLLPQYGNVFTALRFSSFQVASIMSTTGYATADFNLWPIASKMLIFILLFFGSCAGSTAGGMKIVRISVLVKHSLQEIRHAFHPRKVQVVRFEGKGVEASTLKQITVFAFVYMVIILLGGFILSLEGQYDIETNLSAALTAVSNVGPGFGAVGPMGSFAGYSSFSKLFLCLLMLIGRLEIYPILMLFHPAAWRKG